MRCTPPLCTSLLCIALPPSSVVGHALASALPCLSCVLPCSSAACSGKGGSGHRRPVLALVPCSALPRTRCSTHALTPLRALPLAPATRLRASAGLAPAAPSSAPCVCTPTEPPCIAGFPPLVLLWRHSSSGSPAPQPCRTCSCEPLLLSVRQHASTRPRTRACLRHQSLLLSRANPAATRLGTARARRCTPRASNPSAPSRPCSAPAPPPTCRSRHRAA
jgi:hypothetical protein